MKAKILIIAFFVLGLSACGKSMLEQESGKEQAQKKTGFESMYYIRDKHGNCYSVLENGQVDEKWYSVSHTLVPCQGIENELAVDKKPK